MRFLYLMFICVLASPVLARETAPPAANLSSLAEQLAPLLQKTPDLQTLARRQDVVAPVAQKKKEKLSPVEESFSRRANQNLRLFGYNQIGKHLNKAPTTGEIQDDVILGAGDSLLITFRGQRDDSKSYRITPQGQLIIDGMEPVAAAGLSVSALRQQLEQAAEKNLLNSKIYISVKTLRQISVTVMGEVKNPGVYTLSPFQTVLDAMALSRGISKNGSLRNIKLLRAGKATNLDLYTLLLSGDIGVPINLRDGDKIMVPILGETIAIAGDVKRPGIYERAAGKSDFTLQEGLALSGRAIHPGANRHTVFSLTPWGEETLRDVMPDDKATLKDGDLVTITSGEPLRTNGVQVLGHVRLPGPRALNKAPDLQTLLNSSGILREGIYPLFGVIDRFDKKLLAQELVPFSPARIMQGKENVTLHERDKVILFSIEDIRKTLTEKKDQAALVDALGAPLDMTMRNPADLNDLLKPQSGNVKLDAGEKENDNPLLTRDIVALLREHATSVHGAVGVEGLYPLGGKTTLSDLLAVAGGLQHDADKASVEVLLSNPKKGDGNRYIVDLAKDEPGKIWIAARDKVVVSEQYTAVEEQGVMISGEVMRPGKYDLRKGDTLLDLINRAGGITQTGYAPGTVFMRESERRKQEEQYKRVARELDLAVAGYYMKKDAPEKHAEQIRVAENIANDLRRARAVGRITVEADPVVLEANPDTAILLQSGDKIFIPRKPSTVTVGGEVLSPSALQYKAELKGREYIRMAGGTTRYADTGRAFVVFPDGSAQPIGSSFSWNGKGPVPPGSTIIVPRDPDPLDFLAVTSSIGNILSQLAVSTLVVSQLSE